MPAVASTSPGVLLAHLAASTDRIRLGSGGVMLPNHPTLVVAEQFAMLEALHPGRIDLGIGRAPGADPMTAAALRRTVEGLGADDFPAEVIDVLALLGQDLPGRAPSLRASRLSATPVATSSPQVWLLGSSLFSARAGRVAGPAVQLRAPLQHRPHPAGRRRLPARVPTVTRARRAAPDGLGLGARRGLRRRGAYLAGPSRVMALSLRTGRPLGPIVSPEDAARELGALDPWPPPTSSRASRDPGRDDRGPGGRRARRAGGATGADELMITGTAFDVATRVHTLEQVAARWPSDVAADCYELAGQAERATPRRAPDRRPAGFRPFHGEALALVERPARRCSRSARRTAGSLRRQRGRGPRSAGASPWLRCRGST